MRLRFHAFVLTVALSWGGAASVSAAYALDYPTRPIRLIVPYVAGGPLDVLGRLLANGMSGDLNGTVVVENIAGAGGRVGTAAVAKAEPDGYTIGIGVVASLAIGPQLVHTAPYDPIKSFTHIGLVTSGTLTVTVNKSVPAKTLGEFVALAKARPDEISYGSVGVGSLPHMAAELFQRATGTKLRHVPYRGGAASMVDMLAGRIDATFEMPNVTAVYHREGSLRVLATMDKVRSPALPGADADALRAGELHVTAAAEAEHPAQRAFPEPTTAEAGFKGLEMDFWAGVIGPANMPPEIANRLAASIRHVIDQPGFGDSLTAQGLRVHFLPSGEFVQLIRDETARWGEVIAGAGIKLSE